MDALREHCGEPKMIVKHKSDRVTMCQFLRGWFRLFAAKGRETNYPVLSSLFNTRVRVPITFHLILGYIIVYSNNHFIIRNTMKRSSYGSHEFIESAIAWLYHRESLLKVSDGARINATKCGLK